MMEKEKKLFQKKWNEFKEFICPNEGVLIIDEELNATARILDAEDDPIHCSFNNDDCVEIDTSELSYISLTYENLEKLMELILDAQEHYETAFK